MTKKNCEKALEIATDALKQIAEGRGAKSKEEMLRQIQQLAETSLRKIHPLAPHISEYEMALERSEPEAYLRALRTLGLPRPVLKQNAAGDPWLKRKQKRLNKMLEHFCFFAFIGQSVWNLFFMTSSNLWYGLFWYEAAMNWLLLYLLTRARNRRYNHGG